jgi:hypothetical protein
VVPFEEARSNLTINIWLSADGHPLANQIVNLTWLAFCSPNYLARKDRLIPLPYDELRHTPDRYAYTDKTEVFPNFGLPRTVDLFLSKDLYLSSIEGFYKGWGTHYLPWMRGNVTNLHEGAAMFHYAVNATTNFISRTFPLRFEFSQEGRSFIQNGDWFTRGTGTLKSIRKASAPKGLFNPKMQQTVVDWRFHDDETGMDANTYPWTKDSMPRTDDPALQEKFKKRVESMRRHKEQAK